MLDYRQHITDEDCTLALRAIDAQLTDPDAADRLAAQLEVPVEKIKVLAEHLYQWLWEDASNKLRFYKQGTCGYCHGSDGPEVRVRSIISGEVIYEGPVCDECQKHINFLGHPVETDNAKSE